MVVLAHTHSTPEKVRGKILTSNVVSLIPDKRRAKTMATTIERAAEHINAVELSDGSWAHYAEETSRWYVVTSEELEELCDYIDDPDPQISGDAYSHWCNGTDAKEMPEGWKPGQEEDEASSTTIVASISDGMSRNAGGETRITADSYDNAVAQAKQWAREGDYTSPEGDDVEVQLIIADENDAILERLTVTAPSCRA